MEPSFQPSLICGVLTDEQRQQRSSWYLQDRTHQNYLRGDVTGCYSARPIRMGECQGTCGSHRGRCCQPRVERFRRNILFALWRNGTGYEKVTQAGVRRCQSPCSLSRLRRNRVLNNWYASRNGARNGKVTARLQPGIDVLAVVPKGGYVSERFACNV